MLTKLSRRFVRSMPTTQGMLVRRARLPASISTHLSCSTKSRKRSGFRAMDPTPLQRILGLSFLGPHERMAAEVVLALWAIGGAAIVRGRRYSVRAPALMMCRLGFMFDLIASPHAVQWMQWPQWSAALAVVLLCWGLIKLLLDGVDAAAHRS